MKGKLLTAIVFLAVSIVVGVFAAEPPKTDASLAIALLGTWQAPEGPDSPKILSESTYHEDGTVSGFIIGKGRFSDGSIKEVKVQMKAHWRIEKGIVYLNRYESDPTGYVQPGHNQRYEILSVTGNQLVFKDLKDGRELIRIRKKG